MEAKIQQIMDELDEIVAWRKMAHYRNVMSGRNINAILINKLESIISKYTPVDRVGD